VFALNFWGVALAWYMFIRIDMTCVSAPIVRITFHRI
jgi:hypothetical protein